MPISASALRIAIVGPESCGKSTLAADLARELAARGVAAAAVAEYARSYYATRPYLPTPADVLAIARGQLAAEDAAVAAGARVLLCDSTVLTCCIWAEVVFGAVAPELQALDRPQDYALTLLTDCDVPWQFDPLRSHPTQRPWLRDLHRQRLAAAGVDYLLLHGDRRQRVQACWPALQACLPLLPVF